MWLLIDAETHKAKGAPIEARPDAGQDEYVVEMAFGYPDTMIWSAEARGFVDVALPAPLTPLGFQRLFSQPERIAIRTSTDAIVQDFMALSAIALDIDLSDPDVIAGVGYLAHIGLIGAGRVAAILAGQAPS